MSRFTPTLDAGEIIAEWNLSQDDIDHLIRAFREWSNFDRFSDADVARTKTIFRSVFSLPPEMVLQGKTTYDALMLHQPIPSDMLYAMMVDDSGRVAFVRLPFKVWGVYELFEMDFELMCRIANLADPIRPGELEEVRDMMFADAEE